MIGIIDSFDGDYVIIELEDGSYAKLHIDNVSADAREGDEIRFDESEIEILE